MRQPAVLESTRDNRSYNLRIVVHLLELRLASKITTFDETFANRAEWITRNEGYKMWR